MEAPATEELTSVSVCVHYIPNLSHVCVTNMCRRILLGTSSINYYVLICLLSYNELVILKQMWKHKFDSYGIAMFTLTCLSACTAAELSGLT